MKRHMIAFDCGNASIRVILGQYDGNRIETDVIRQVPNDAVQIHRYIYWDILRIYHELLIGLKEAVETAGRIDSIGICTWGVDFALFDRRGQMVQNPLSYRNDLGARMLERLSQPEQIKLYEATGTLCDKINSVYMLQGIRENMPEVYGHGERLLMLPDILNNMFTGVWLNEPSALSTTQLMDTRTRQISRTALKQLGLSDQWFGPSGRHGQAVGSIHPAVKAVLGIDYDIPVVCVPSHDTAAAAFAVPAETDYLFISAGTWALIGMVLNEPLISDQARAYGLTNEIGAFDQITLLRNHAGMFLLQRLRAEYESLFGPTDWETFNRLGDAAPDPVPVFDVNDDRFFNPRVMSAELWRFFSETEQVAAPVSDAIYWPVLLRSVQISLALGFAESLAHLEQVTGLRRDAVHIVGGGSLNERLCQLTANFSGKRVIAGGKESTSLGNLAAQIRYFEPDQSLQRIKEIIGCSVQSRTYAVQTDAVSGLGCYQKGRNR